MDNKKNSIKEILTNTKDLLTKDSELSKEKEDFDAKLSKALEGNILTLNKLANKDTIDELDQRSKKITQIVEFQSNETLLLDTEIKDQSEILLLNNEILEKDKEINEKEIQNILVASENQDKIDGLDTKFNSNIDQSEVSLKLNKEESVEEGKNYLSILERIEQLEEQKKTITKKLEKSIEENELRDPSEEISLKFDILSNQISNDIDSKIDLINNDINIVNEEKDGIYQELNSQKESVESGFSGLELSNENLKNQIDNIDLKIKDGQKNQEENIENKLQGFGNKLQGFESKIEENIDSKLLLFENKINSKLQELQHILEEDRAKKKLEEEEKNNDPDYQANLRLNSIYKILEAQMSQSLINNNLSANKESPDIFRNQYIKNAPTEVTSVENSNTIQKTNQMLESILHSTHTLSEEIDTLKKQESNHPQAIESSKIELISSQLNSLIDQQTKLDKIHEEIYSLSNQQFKSDEVKNKIHSLSDQQSKIEAISKHLESLPEEKKNLNSTLSEQLVKLEEIFSFLKSAPVQKDKTEKLDNLIQYFKSSELQKMSHIKFDFVGIQQFEDLKSSKKFLEKMILSETQNWIKLNQKTIEDISKKLLYK
jgi:hypothetical protein|tara:strand:+ start:86 stop:1891 length:1806 start_codon:yes stop_codon:yes gene_type:complete